jgi:hypothetical protein
MWYRSPELSLQSAANVILGEGFTKIRGEPTKVAFPSSAIVDILPISTGLARQIHR